MPNKEEADKAIAGMNGKDLKGRALTVNEARPRTHRPRTGGGGARGGFGGGRGSIYRRPRTIRQEMSRICLPAFILSGVK
jgi:hypothetical protein